MILCAKNSFVTLLDKFIEINKYQILQVWLKAYENDQKKSAIFGLDVMGFLSLNYNLPILR